MSEELLRDALDHIARVAAMARTPTKRLDWIVQRARTALAGDRFDHDYAPSLKARPHDENCGFRKDAMRYRYLRVHSTGPVEPWSTHSHPASLDKIVDDAIAALSVQETGSAPQTK